MTLYVMLRIGFDKYNIARARVLYIISLSNTGTLNNLYQSFDVILDGQPVAYLLTNDDAGLLLGRIRVLNAHSSGVVMNSKSSVAEAHKC
jgi:hypothetical protein